MSIVIFLLSVFVIIYEVSKRTNSRKRKSIPPPVVNRAELPKPAEPEEPKNEEAPRPQYAHPTLQESYQSLILSLLETAKKDIAAIPPAQEDAIEKRYAEFHHAITEQWPFYAQETKDYAYKAARDFRIEVSRKLLKWHLNVIDNNRGRTNYAVNYCKEILAQDWIAAEAELPELQQIRQILYTLDPDSIPTPEPEAEQPQPARGNTAWDAFREMSKADAMDGHEFEHWCAEILRGNGFTSVEVTRGSGDHGVDIIAHRQGKKWAIQCKRYSHDLGNKPVQEVYTGMAVYGCTAGAVMTNKSFTDGAKTAARATGVELWGRDRLKSMLETAMHVEFEEEDLWPQNINTGNINYKYYKALPHIPFDPSFPEFIDCYPIPDETVNPYLTEEYHDPDFDFHLVELVTPPFATEQEAERFRRALEKRYYAYIPYIRQYSDGTYFFAAYVHGKYILSKFDEDENCWHLENWA